MGSQPKWTVLVYMVADTGDSFYQDAMDGITEMMRAPFNGGIGVIVYADAPSPWKCKCWQVTGSPKVKEGEPLEKESGHATEYACGRVSLLHFVQTCVKRYPSDYYLLVLWGHGEGIDWKQKVIAAPQPGSSIQASAKRFAPGSQGAIEVGDLGKALAGLDLNRLDKKNVVVGFDACLMGMVEVYYEISNCVGWGVAGADEIPDTGWSYTDILRALGECPEADPRQLADKIVDTCADWYSVHSPDTKVTFAACDLSNSDSVLEAMTNLTKELCDCIKNKSVRTAVKDARDFAEDFQEKAYIDLWAFCSELRRRTNQGLPEHQRLHSAAGCVIDALRNFVSRHKFSDAYPQKFAEDARGLSICFPASADLVGSIPNLRVNWGAYKELAFSQTTHWPEFLTEFWGRRPVADDGGTMTLPDQIVS